MRRLLQSPSVRPRLLRRVGASILRPYSATFVLTDSLSNEDEGSANTDTDANTGVDSSELQKELLEQLSHAKNGSEMDSIIERHHRKFATGCPRTDTLSRLIDEDLPYGKRTMEWLEDSVIGLNLCPFADRPLQQGNVRIRVLQGADQVQILASSLAECFVRQSEPGTTLVVCPHLFPRNFEAFLEVYNMLQDGALVENDLDRDLQVAPFHPDFQFQDSDPEDIENWTNRSPYPIFHILREEEVSAAVRALDGDSSRVWQRNINFLKALSEKYGAQKVADWIQHSSVVSDETFRTELRAFAKDFNRKQSK